MTLHPFLLNTHLEQKVHEKKELNKDYNINLYKRKKDLYKQRRREALSQPAFYY